MVSDMADAAVAPAVLALRRFNRSHTQRIGALDESFLDTGRPLGESRLLFEIGPDGTPVGDLRRRLALDSGYLSRLLRRLEADGLVTTLADPADGRRRVVRLTARGRRAWIDLDERSDRIASDLVSSLDERRRAALVEHLDAADRLLRAATLEFVVVDPRGDEAVGALRRYFGELSDRFADGFDPGDTLTTDAAAFDPPDGAFIVARDGIDVVACGGIQRADASSAEIKRMWVADAWRGIGLGKRTLGALEQSARERGHRRVILDTNATLREAIAMYESAGYRPIERYNDNPYAQRWFAKELDADDR